MHKRGKPALLRLDKSRDDTPNEPTKTLSNNAFNSASNRAANIDIEAVEQQLVSTFSRLSEQNKDYWQSLASDPEDNQVITNYKNTLSKLNLTEIDEIIPGFSINDKNSCMALIKNLQSINFVLSYAKLRECCVKKDSLLSMRRQ